ncbi:MAG: hypothetical protein JNM88_03115 [Chitinophagaceae bacterium]|nr:hypothetical protein [Chitinophagaceae bacterium]
MNIEFDKNFPVRVWLASIFIGALLLLFISFFLFPPEMPDTEIPDRLFGLLMTGTVFSSLFFVIIYLLFRKLISLKSMTPKRLKRILAIITVGGMLLLCIFFGLDFSRFSIELLVPLAYAIAILSAIGLNDVVKKRNEY